MLIFFIEDIDSFGVSDQREELEVGCFPKILVCIVCGKILVKKEDYFFLGGKK